MIKLVGHHYNTHRTLSGVTELSSTIGDNEYRINSKGKFQWKWTSGHKKTEWVTWAKVVFDNQNQKLIVRFNRPNALWAIEVLTTLLSMSQLVEKQWNEQKEMQSLNKRRTRLRGNQKPRFSHEDEDWFFNPND